MCSAAGLGAGTLRVVTPGCRCLVQGGGGARGWSLLAAGPVQALMLPRGHQAVLQRHRVATAGLTAARLPPDPASRGRFPGRRWTPLRPRAASPRVYSVLKPSKRRVSTLDPSAARCLLSLKGLCWAFPLQPLLGLLWASPLQPPFLGLPRACPLQPLLGLPPRCSPDLSKLPPFPSPPKDARPGVSRRLTPNPGLPRATRVHRSVHAVGQANTLTCIFNTIPWTHTQSLGICPDSFDFFQNVPLLLSHSLLFLSLPP